MIHAFGSTSTPRHRRFKHRAESVRQLLSVCKERQCAIITSCTKSYRKCVAELCAITQASISSGQAFHKEIRSRGELMLKKPIITTNCYLAYYYCSNILLRIARRHRRILANRSRRGLYYFDFSENKIPSLS